MIAEVLSEECWPAESRASVFAVRQRARELAIGLGLPAAGVEAVTIAVSELASNIVDHARAGVMTIRTVRERERLSLVAIARDDGPGIADVAWALRDGCSTGNGLGCGLSAVKRLMDEFHIHSVIGEGTVITVRKWVEMPSPREKGKGSVHGRS